MSRCPLCGAELAPEGELLRCPSGHYLAGAKEYSDRWDKYSEEAEDPSAYYDGLAAAESLLTDLKKLNQVKETE